MRLRRFLVGTAAAGVLWACLEVLWIQLQPLIPTELLGHRRRSMPPRDLLALARIAIATYVPLAVLLGLAALLLLRRRLRRSSPQAAFALGVFAGGAALAILGSVLWIQLMLPGLPLASPRALALYAGGVAVGAATAGLFALLLARALPSMGTGLLACAALSLVLLGGAALAASRIDRPPLAKRGTPAGDLPNVVFVTIDTLRADHLGAYSEGRFDTPVFDRFAREGVRFARAISQIPHTTPSHISIFTSVYPSVHGARNGLPMRNDLETLPTHLKRMGYHTAAFVAAYTTKSNVTGLGESFDVYVDSMNPRAPFLSADELEPLAAYRVLDRLQGNRVPAPVVNRRVVDWLESDPPEPFFLWVHYFDPHTPYPPLPRYQEILDLKAGPGYREQLEKLYPEAVRYTDEQLGALMQALEGRGLLEDAVVAITSDHGEALGEAHPNQLVAIGDEAPAWRDYGHGSSLYDPVLRVPLVLWSPGRLAGGRVVDTQVESIDVATMLLDVIGRDAPDSFRGRSLQAVLREDAAGEDRAAISQTDGAVRLQSGKVRAQLFSVRTRDWKLVVDSDDEVAELYDLREDPAETRNRIESQPEVAATLRQRLEGAVAFDEPTRELDEMDPATLQRLQALGYLVDDEEAEAPESP